VPHAQETCTRNLYKKLAQVQKLCGLIGRLCLKVYGTIKFLERVSPLQEVLARSVRALDFLKAPS